MQSGSLQLHSGKFVSLYVTGSGSSIDHKKIKEKKTNVLTAVSDVPSRMGYQTKSCLVFLHPHAWYYFYQNNVMQKLYNPN